MSKISDVVPTPTFVVPNPTITPLSPEYETTLTSSSVYDGGATRTGGTLVFVYPVPALDSVMLVTTPAVIDAVAVAVVPSPTDCAVLPIVTIGADVYPEPPSEIEMEDMVPSPETIAVAAAPIKLS